MKFFGNPHVAVAFVGLPDNADRKVVDVFGQAGLSPFRHGFAFVDKHGQAVKACRHRQHVLGRCAPRSEHCAFSGVAENGKTELGQGSFCVVTRAPKIDLRIGDFDNLKQWGNGTSSDNKTF